MRSVLLFCILACVAATSVVDFRSALIIASNKIDATLTSRSSGSWPTKTSPDGTSWVTVGTRSSGYTAGLAWLMFENTGNTTWATLAAAAQNGLPTTGYDLGLIHSVSYGNQYRLLGDASALNTMVNSRAKLSTTYWRNGLNSISSRGQVYNAKFYSLFMDNLVDLDLFWTLDSVKPNATYTNYAQSTAGTFAKEFVRSDNSTFQLIEFIGTKWYVTSTKGTQTGYDGDSTQTRSHAFAVLGFALATKHDTNYLVPAQSTADYLLQKTQTDPIPFYDVADSTTKDSSAAAVFAAGLLTLSAALQEGATGKYFVAAERILNTLHNDYTAPHSSASVLAHGVRNFQSREVDDGLIEGDYWYVKALLLYSAQVVEDITSTSVEETTSVEDITSTSVQDITSTSVQDITSVKETTSTIVEETTSTSVEETTNTSVQDTTSTSVEETTTSTRTETQTASASTVMMSFMALLAILLV